MRKGHFLSHNTRTELPSRMIWVDTEALNEHGKPEVGEQKLWFGVAHYERYHTATAREPTVVHRKVFYTPESFWEWVTSLSEPKARVWIMAHNWNYDAAILNTSVILPKLGWSLGKYINGKPPLIVTWRKDDCTLQMVDTLNYFTSSLANLGESLGVPKADMPKLVANVQEWEAYCARDVAVIRAGFLGFREFVREHNLGVMQPTLASQALTAYRHRFMPCQILIHTKEEALELERESYHGGRTEAFWYGPYYGKLYKFDINSMYPSIMRDNELSARYVGYFPSYKRHLWAAAKRDYNRVAECWISTETPVYGIVRDQRLIFPVGRFKATLAEPELVYALDHDHVEKIGRWAIYERENLFREFVDYFYNVRQEYQKAGNDAFAFMAKILMNSLYGKFGQAGRIWIETDEYIWTEGQEGVLQIDEETPPIRLRNRLGRTQMLQVETESHSSAPAIAAEITSHARLLLWRLIEQAGRENVVYVDTDSLVVSEAGYLALGTAIDSKILGKLKLEGESNYSEFWAPKDYLFAGKQRTKGIRASAEKISEVDYRQERFQSWDVNLKEGQDGFVTVTTTLKHLTRINHKALVNGHGPTYPLTLKEW